LVQVFGETAWHPVHRLDADTTGLVVLAKTATAATHLGRQFESRTVKKVYLARVHGVAETDHFVCALPLTIAPDAAGKRSTRGNAPAVAAHTDFSVVARFGNETLVTANPSSGRTNQIRAHLAALGLPIVGDAAYGGDEAFTSGRSTLCLHAAQLSFRHPDDERWLEFSAPAPAFARSGYTRLTAGNASSPR
jgi:23S rRNA pseudouridine955/2504/2580 synthase